jgi:cobalt transporter subunit CbtA
VAATLLTVVQLTWITPLILQAETYEEAAEHLADGHAAGAEHHDHSGAGHHHHDESEWKPRDGWQRSSFTWGANLLVGVGYGLVVVAAFLLWRAPRSTVWGVAYGIAGFAIFFAAPGLGLPPELPGTAAAELSTRQEWWVMTVAATAAGLVLFFSRVPVWVRVLAVVLIVAPHLISAPHPAVEASLAPEALQDRFRLATSVGNAVFWLSLGLTAAGLFRRFGLGSAPAHG